MGKAERRKGHDFERRIARLIRDAIVGAPVRRGIQSRDGGDAPDVECPGFWIECKVGKNPPIRPALRQAEAANPGGRWSVAVTKADREPVLVTMTFADWLEMAEQWWRGRQ